MIAVRDGDNLGCKKSKADLDKVLSENALKKRGRNERIATPAPTLSIETWLLALLDDNDVAITEDLSLKGEFERRYRDDKQIGEALTKAARSWRLRAVEVPSSPSLKDGYSELLRVDTVTKTRRRPGRG